MVKQLSVKSSQRCQLIDITQLIENQVRDIKEGLCTIYIPHTTAAVLLNENADVSVAEDINEYLSKLIPNRGIYRHLEGNADAHIKAAIVGQTKTLIIKDGKLLLGRWQGIFFCEFDGPRQRSVFVYISGT